MAPVALPVYYAFKTRKVKTLRVRKVEKGGKNVVCRRVK